MNNDKSYEPDKQRDRRESRQEIDEFRLLNIFILTVIPVIALKPDPVSYSVPAIIIILLS
jgi:hypothetical protein